MYSYLAFMIRIDRDSLHVGQQGDTQGAANQNYGREVIHGGNSVGVRDSSQNIM